MPEMGEYLVGAWLKLCGSCELIVYNQKLSPRGIKMNEVDVIGIAPHEKKAFFCEVGTHLGGLLYAGGNEGTAQKVEEKFKAMIKYASTIFPEFKIQYMLWAPYVPEGILTGLLSKIQVRLQNEDINVQLIINSEYTSRVNQLRMLAKGDTRDRGEPFYRAMQIIENLR
jgi:hypothetical protein